MRTRAMAMRLALLVTSPTRAHADDPPPQTETEALEADRRTEGSLGTFHVR